ncbi:MAG: hypothetical protein A8274_360 [Halanaerobium sp. 4-GBenrich]|jgi:uncharacterized protein YutE (UPF0331/DUF86 family)|uniref:Uncharacterized conserved protein YutE, UPF0331/DUF86 family n=1 Tax=Halanaerobium congolense TaxID=54121 RepID=A0A1G6INH9_9FIRM|nr:DUF86 domain-containing protein [Halanaerobium congolense]KXS50359.1 MAG: hypothetical protein AWL62_183 [Halanaerobium sp. T82-1]ODS50683.1 MAG: hypothetical protein A8274_360 [Halanaerobium sp. 4-GBenrich]PUU92382.1 MAG: hypothetical protein CI948_716 [Halanaerobium sp.]PTX15917.1 uncharacterized protein YutE (UPF0331/DUF86 family) [Halanaerobium congolense]PXV64510.1 uncharacterized protein YutE (UPF0331/DUF86 family) [Halanaerobium congolense]
MVKKEIILERSQKCNEYLSQLEEIIEGVEFDDFNSKPLLYGSAERFLHLSIEALIDIGNHIISDNNLGRVNVYKDIALILAENGYLTEEEKKLFIKIIAFRNILVHDYMDLDRDVIFNLLKNNLKDIRGILKSYLKLI